MGHDGVIMMGASLIGSASGETGARSYGPGSGSRTGQDGGRSYQVETPFDSIEGSYEYVAMLAEAVTEAGRDVEAEIATAEFGHAERRKEALLLVSYNLAKLDLHITSSRRILNDLRTLRRLLLGAKERPLRS
jgi:hypothetical protein